MSGLYSLFDNNRQKGTAKLSRELDAFDRDIEPQLEEMSNLRDFILAHEDLDRMVDDTNKILRAQGAASFGLLDQAPGPVKKRTAALDKAIALSDAVKDAIEEDLKFMEAVCIDGKAKAKATIAEIVKGLGKRMPEYRDVLVRIDEKINGELARLQQAVTDGSKTAHTTDQELGVLRENAKQHEECKRAWETEKVKLKTKITNAAKTSRDQIESWKKTRASLVDNATHSSAHHQKEKNAWVLEKAKLEKELALSNQAKTTAVEAKRQLELKIANEKNSLRQVSAECATAKGKLDQLNFQHVREENAWIAEKKKLEGEIKSGGAELQRRQNSWNAAREAFQKTISEHQLASKDWKTERQNSASMIADLNKQLAEKIKSWALAKSQFETVIKQDEEKLIDLVAAKDALASDKGSLEIEIATLKGAKSTALATKETLEQVKADRDRVHQEHEKSAKSFTDLSSSWVKKQSELKEQIVNLMAQCIKWKEEEKPTLEKRIQALTNLSSDWDGQKSELNRQIECLKEQSSNWNAEKLEWSKEMQNWTNLSSGWSREITELNRNIETTQTKLDTAEEGKRYLDTKLDEIQANLAETSSKLKFVQEEKQQVERKLEDKISAHAVTSRELTNTKSTLEGINDQLTKSQSELATANTKIGDIDGKLSTSEQSRQATESSRDELQTKLNEQTRIASDTQTQLDEQTAITDARVRDLATSASTIEKLVNETNNARTESNRLTELLRNETFLAQKNEDAKHRSIRALINVRDEFRDDIEQLRIELGGAQNSTLRLNVELGTLRRISEANVRERDVLQREKADHDHYQVQWAGEKSTLEGEVHALKQSKELCDRQISTLNQNKTQSETSIRQKDVEIKRFKDIEAANEALVKARDEFKEKFDKAQEYFEDQRRTSNMYKTRRDELSTEKTNLLNQVDQLNRNIASLTGQLNLSVPRTTFDPIHKELAALKAAQVLFEHQCKGKVDPTTYNAAMLKSSEHETCPVQLKNVEQERDAAIQAHATCAPDIRKLQEAKDAAENVALQKIDVIVHDHLKNDLKAIQQEHTNLKNEHASCAASLQAAQQSRENAIRQHILGSRENRRLESKIRQIEHRMSQQVSLRTYEKLQDQYKLVHQQWYDDREKSNRNTIDRRAGHEELLAQRCAALRIIERLQQEIADANVARQQLDVEHQALEWDRAQVQDDLEAMQGKKQALDDHLYDKSRSYRWLDSRYSTLRGERNDLDRLFSDKTRLYDELQTRYATVVHEKDNIDGLLAGKSRQCKEIAATVAGLTEERDVARRLAADRIPKDQHVKVKEELSTCRQDLDAQREQLGNCASQIQQLQNAYASHRQRHHNCHERVPKEEYDALERQMESNVLSTKGMIDGMTKGVRQIMEKNAAILSHHTNCDETGTQLLNLEEAMARFKIDHANCEKTKASLLSLAAEMSAFKGKHTKCEETKMEFSSLRKVTDAFKEKHQDCDATIGELFTTRQQFEAFKASHANCVEQANQLLALQHDHEKCQEKVNKDIHDSLQARFDEINNAHRNCAQFRTRVPLLEQELDQAKTVHENCSNELEAMRRRVEAAAESNIGSPAAGSGVLNNPLFQTPAAGSSLGYRCSPYGSGPYAGQVATPSLTPLGPSPTLSGPSSSRGNIPSTPVHGGRVAAAPDTNIGGSSVEDSPQAMRLPGHRLYRFLSSGTRQTGLRIPANQVNQALLAAVDEEIRKWDLKKVDKWGFTSKGSHNKCSRRRLDKNGFREGAVESEDPEFTCDKCVHTQSPCVLVDENGPVVMPLRPADRIGFTINDKGYYIKGSVLARR